MGSFYDDSFARLLAASPEVAAELGLRDVAGHPIPHGRWSDVSPEGDAQRDALMQSTLAKLHAADAGLQIDPRDADTPEAINRGVYEFFLRYAYFGRLRGADCPPLCDSIADHLDGVQTEILTCLTQWHPRGRPEDEETLRERVAGVPRQIGALIEGLQARTAAGNTMPSCVL